jgi:hypothetical protein
MWGFTRERYVSMSAVRGCDHRTNSMFTVWVPKEAKYCPAALDLGLPRL